jgi:hypothetical protein
MKEIETKHYWQYPFDLLTFANFRKYPNEFADHVISNDVLSRKILPNGLMVTDRLLQLKQPIPSFLRRLGLPFPETTYFFERSILNPQTQAFEATTHNLSMRSFFQATEICSYFADKESGGTNFHQKASFTACSYFSKIIEDFAVSRFESNADKGRKGLRSVLQALEDELEEFGTKFGQKIGDVKHSLEDLEHRMHGTMEDVKTQFSAFEESCAGNWENPLDHNPFC